MSSLNDELVRRHMGDMYSSSTEKAVNRACRGVLRAAGVRRVGQTIRVLKGRHRGLTEPVAVINWSEAEVQVQRCPRWFSLWYDRAYFEVLT